jgi:ribosomal protein S18 acetylase RimI-like enzyme
MGSYWSWSKWGRSLKEHSEPDHPLDNAVWWALGGRHEGHAASVGRARRYRRDVSVFAAVDEFDDASWSDLATLFGPAGAGSLFRADIPTEVPAGWHVKARGWARQMVLNGDAMAQVEQHQFRQLTEDDVPDMLKLVELAKPGPFRPATIALGGYVGHFDGPRLMAMAGQRLSLEGHTEISAVCTHPDARGHGLAAALTHTVASAILARGEQPILHVAETNEDAYRVYQRLGFTQRQRIEFALVGAPR